MNQPYVRYADSNSSSSLSPQGWLTNSQREHSENFTGSEKNRMLADVIRDREVVGSDGIVRERPAVSLSYSQALGLIGMGEE